MASVGVIGGGQLARMMTPPAINLGLEIKVLAEAAGSSAAMATTQVGDYTHLDVVREFAETVDVITFDHEHVPLPVLEALEAEGVRVNPPSKALAFAQNKLKMRKRLGDLGLPMPSWAEIQDARALQTFIDANGGVAILKTPIGGYDGKGVRVVRSAEDAADWLANLDQYGGSLLAEECVDFVRELAQLSARRPSGEFKALAAGRDHPRERRLLDCAFTSAEGKQGNDRGNGRDRPQGCRGARSHRSASC